MNCHQLGQEVSRKDAINCEEFDRRCSASVRRNQEAVFEYKRFGLVARETYVPTHPVFAGTVLGWMNELFILHYMFQNSMLEYAFRLFADAAVSRGIGY